MEFIHPAVAEVKCFSNSCPFQHCSLKVDLWLRLQCAPFFSLLPLHRWQLDTRHYMAVRAEMSFTLLSFTISFLLFFSSSHLLYHFSRPSFLLPSSPIYKGDRVIRVWAVVSSPIHFYLCVRGLILQSHILLSQSTPSTRPSPLWFVSEVGRKKKKANWILCHLNRVPPPRHPLVPSPHIRKTHLHFGLVIWLQQ